MAGRWQLLPPEELEEIAEVSRQYDNVLEDAQAELFSRGISLPPKPAAATVTAFRDLLDFGEAGDPIMPEDLTLYDLEGIGKLYSLFNGWCGYVRGQVSLFRRAHDLSKGKVTMIEARLKLLFKDEGRVMDVEAAVNSNPDLIEAQLEVERANALREIGGARLRELEDNCKTISRELTRSSLVLLAKKFP